MAPDCSSMAEYSQQFLRYHDETERLRSYYNENNHWPPDAPISPEELAYAGFFYTGTFDKVQCPYCYLKVYNWQPDDIAIFEHKRHARSRCSYVCGLIDVDAEGQGQTHPFNVMTSVPVRAVIGMGYSQDTIRSGLDNLCSKLSIDEFSVSTIHLLTTMELLNAIFELDDDYHSASAALEMQTDPLTSVANSEIVSTSIITSHTISGIGSKPPRCNNGSTSITVSSFVSTDSTSTTAAIPSVLSTLQVDDSRESNLQELVALRQRIDMLEKENMSFKQLKTCCVCLDESVDTVFLPCRHFVCCSTCTARIRYCPLCRARIMSKVHVFSPFLM